MAGALREVYWVILCLYYAYCIACRGSLLDFFKIFLVFKVLVDIYGP